MPWEEEFETEEQKSRRLALAQAKKEGRFKILLLSQEFFCGLQFLLRPQSTTRSYVLNIPELCTVENVTYVLDRNSIGVLLCSPEFPMTEAGKQLDLIHPHILTVPVEPHEKA